MFDTLLAEIAMLNRPHGEVWFRGHSDASWSLVPRLLRSEAGKVQEKNILARFRSRAMGMLTNPPSDNDPARWLFLMQHYGLPTRLLDWTESALAALFFASQGHDDRDGCIYIMLPMDLNNSQTGEPVLYAPYTKPIHELMLSCFHGTEKQTITLAVLAFASNDRITRQHANFTMHGSESDLRTLLNSGWSRIVTTPAATKPTIRRQLAYFGITRASLFNDLDSLASDLREEHSIG